MSEMLERCARAIYERAKTMPNGIYMMDWDRLAANSGARKYWREYAAAVLDALMEPTPGMREAGSTVIRAEYIETGELALSIDVFRAMITAAKETK